MTDREFICALKKLNLATTRQAAARFNVHVATINRAKKDGPHRLLSERVQRELEKAHERFQPK